MKKHTYRIIELDVDGEKFYRIETFCDGTWKHKDSGLYGTLRDAKWQLAYYKAETLEGKVIG